MRQTMAAVQEVSNDGGTAGGPWLVAVNLDECGRHHVVLLQLAKVLLAGLCVVMGHVEDMACARNQPPNPVTPFR